ncbi:protein mono-ADP-ribosyltransferase PARP4 isoform X2 [Ictalurus furcatus]|uniref:protein mono-ADP-ribosyltransferase PARP4 isoform X2 n=1 Tax=Ictalurus furcatus TaxID=66913 RepID=UPI0023502C9B|nr:protein mono-ADP-ribosyltransferase PARP4 isoform X2 [Ictalurus furcatus]
MAIFSDCSVVLDLKNVPFKEKRKLMTAILDNGGNISYVVNQKCSFVVATSLENISTSRWRSAQKHQTPVVDLQYVWSCLEKGLLLPVQEHVLKPQSSDLTPEQAPHPGVKSRDWLQVRNSGVDDERAQIEAKDGSYLGRFRFYTENDRDVPEFSSDFQVAKYSILSKLKTWSVLELQSAKGQAGQQYRVVSSIMHEAEKSVSWDKQVHSCSSEDAVEAYLMLRKELQVQGFTQTQTFPPWAEKLTSHGLRQLLLEEKLNCSTVSQDVGVFVELIWTEALGSLRSILTVPVTNISLNDVSRVEGLLLQVQKSQRQDEVKGLLEQVNTLLPLRIREPDSKNKLVSQKLDLCQLIRDILNMTEATLGNPSPSSLGKYRALRCSIEQVPCQSPEFLRVSQLLQDRPAQIQQILRVSRATELRMFKNELGNVKSLLHSTSSSSLVGILSRGLLLPKVGVEQHGIERTDIGNLGSGIYFSDSLNTSVKYSKASVTDGCRLLLVCEVALGQCKDLHERAFGLTSAPEGYNSVHGVRRTEKTHSDFEDDEYVVYNTDQIRLKYVVRYFLPEDEVKDFQPHVDTTLAPLHSASSSHFLSSDDGEGLGVTKNPLEEVTAGLLDSNGQTLPLQAVHVRCKLMDLLSQVVIFQTYTNDSSVPIEAKYVFPLEETAAVCGFEAFINGKHVVGKVKEKEQARKEYKQAIEKGHGAYLMDQDAPDVFTISVGNLPPGATVLIKVTFITELVVRAGTIVFSLPGSVAPWQQSSALNQRTQTTVEKVCVNELQPEGEFSLCMSIEMPYEIVNLECSHQIKIKRTDCKAVVSTLPDQTLSTDGFRLSFTLHQIHMPRMWVEKHPEKDTEACMLVFYPHFESSGVSGSDVSDVIVVLDTSESMRGEAMLNARRIALKVLNSLDRSLRVNIISFGSDYKEAFPSANSLEEGFEEAKNFIMSSAAVGGSTELWRPLRTLNLLPPSRGVRNVVLISDGHVQNQPETLQLVRDNVRHTRLFTCGLSLTANRYMLRALAQAGGGTYEFFDTKAKHTWAEKVNSQVRCMVSPGCSSVAVKWQQFNPTAPSPVQAPSQLHALFSDSHTLVYGFVPHCTRATLFGDLSGQEIETMVCTTELQETKGTFLHKLTARAIIRDYEDGSLGSSEAEHEGKKAELKSYIIELSKEFSILSQFTSFVAIEERDQEQPESGFTDVPKIIAEEDVDILSYMGWTEQKQWDEEADSGSVLLGGYCELEGDSPLEGDYLLAEEDEFYEACECGEIESLEMGFSCLESAMVEDVSSTTGSVPQFEAFSYTTSTNTNEKTCSSLPPLQEQMARPSSGDFNRNKPFPKFKRVKRVKRALDPVRLSLPATNFDQGLGFGSDVYGSATRDVLDHSDLVFTSPQISSPPSRSPRNEFEAHPPRPSSNIQGASRLIGEAHPPLSSCFQALPGEGLEPLNLVLMESPLSDSLRATTSDLVFRAAAPTRRTIGAPLRRTFVDSLGRDCVTSHAPSPSFGIAPRPSLPNVDSVDRACRTPHAPSPSFSTAPRHLLPSVDSIDRACIADLAPSPYLSIAAPPPPPSVAFGFGGSAPPPPPPSVDFGFLGSAPSPARPPSVAFGFSGSAPPPPPPSVDFGFLGSVHSAARPPSVDFGFGAPAHPPPPPSFAFRLGASAHLPPPGVAFGAPAPPPPPPPAPRVAFGFGAPAHPPPPPPSGAIGFQTSCSNLLQLQKPPSYRPVEQKSQSRYTETVVEVDSGSAESYVSTIMNRLTRLCEIENSAINQSTVPLVETDGDSVQTDGVSKRHRRPDRINWDELFNLQHRDGYWECTGTLSRFLGLDVDFFANVFLREKGICSLGAKAHADILKLISTLLVLQLMRVMKMADGELFQSLFRLTDRPEPRPACWEAVKRAVEWVCWADRQYPCMCSRLEFGRDWESCTRQLLGLDSLPPFSPLIPVLQRSTRLPVNRHETVIFQTSTVGR